MQADVPTSVPEAATKPLGPLARTVYSLIRGLIRGAAKLIGRIDIYGADRIPDGAFVLAPVHRSNVDFALASLATTRRMRFMTKDSVWKSKWLGAFVASMGGFPVSRGTVDRESLHTCIALLAAGESVVMFPEGTRRSGPVVEDLFDGPAYVAARTQVPVVPIGIGGSEAMMPKGSKLIHPSKLVVVVGEPLEPPPLRDGGGVSRRAVKEFTDELRIELQKQFVEAQSRASRA